MRIRWEPSCHRWPLKKNHSTSRAVAGWQHRLLPLLVLSSEALNLKEGVFGALSKDHHQVPWSQAHSNLSYLLVEHNMYSPLIRLLTCFMYGSHFDVKWWIETILFVVLCCVSNDCMEFRGFGKMCYWNNRISWLTSYKTFAWYLIISNILVIVYKCQLLHYRKSSESWYWCNN